MSAIIVAHGGAGEISDARAASKVSNLQKYLEHIYMAVL